MKKTIFILIFAIIGFSVFASFSLGGTFDFGIAQDILARAGSYDLFCDVRFSLNANFEVRLPIEFVYIKDGSMINAGLSLAYYPFEKIGLFCSLSLIQLGFINPRSLLSKSNISLNEASFGYTHKFKNNFFVEGALVIRDPSGTFSDEYKALEEVFGCYKKFRARLCLGYSYKFK